MSKQAPLDLRALRQATEPAPALQKAPVLLGTTTQLAIKYAAPDGQVYEDTITIRVSTVDDKVRIGRMQAYLAGAEPYDKMPSDWQAWAKAHATLATLIDDPPDWLSKWAPEDELLLFSIYNKIYQHEALFFRADLSARGGKAGERLVLVAEELDAAAGALAEQRGAGAP